MTTAQQIDNWFESGIEDGATHMIVVVDELDYDDYPVYVWGGEVRAQLDSIAGAEMQRVMEVYDLSLSKGFQLAEVRAWHVPA